MQVWLIEWYYGLKKYMEVVKMRVQVTLTPSESKRLIAKGVVKLPSIQNALENHTIILAGGTTNGFLVEEFLGETLDKKKYIFCGNYIRRANRP